MLKTAYRVGMHKAMADAVGETLSRALSRTFPEGLGAETTGMARHAVQGGAAGAAVGALRADEGHRLEGALGGGLIGGATLPSAALSVRLLWRNSRAARDVARLGGGAGLAGLAREAEAVKGTNAVTKIIKSRNKARDVSESNLSLLTVLALGGTGAAMGLGPSQELGGQVTRDFEDSLHDDRGRRRYIPDQD